MTETITISQLRAQSKAKKPNKYGNKRSVINGEAFASKAEIRHWNRLKQRSADGEITGLRRQVVFILAPPVKIEGEKKRRPILRYTADAVYYDKAGDFVVEDCKGVVDTSFRIRQHLMKFVHGIDVRIVK